MGKQEAPVTAAGVTSFGGSMQNVYKGIWCNHYHVILFIPIAKSGAGGFVGPRCPVPNLIAPPSVSTRNLCALAKRDVVREVAIFE